MGARPLKRAIQSVIEDPLSEKILAEEFTAGCTVTAGYRGGQVTFTGSRKKSGKETAEEDKGQEQREENEEEKKEA